MIRGNEIVPADLQVAQQYAQRYLKSRAVDGRYQLLVDAAVPLLFVGVVIVLAAVGVTETAAFTFPVLGILVGLIVLVRSYRIRLWCDSHPDIANAPCEPSGTHRD